MATFNLPQTSLRIPAASEPQPSGPTMYVATGVAAREYDPLAVGQARLNGTASDERSTFERLTGRSVEDNTERISEKVTELEDQGAFADTAAGQMRAHLERVAHEAGFGSIAEYEAHLEAERQRQEAEAAARKRQEEEDAYCREFVNDLLVRMNGELAKQNKAAAELYDLTIRRYPEFFYDFRGFRDLENDGTWDGNGIVTLSDYIQDKIRLLGREYVPYRDSDIENVHAAEGRFRLAWNASQKTRLIISRLEAEEPTMGADNIGCWRRYKERLASRPPAEQKVGKSKALPFALLAGALLGVF